MNLKRFSVVIGLVAGLLGGGVALRRHHKRHESGAKAGELFRAEVAPLLERNCLSCHGPEEHEGDLRLDSRAALLLGGKTGPAVMPGDPGNSLLLKLVSHTDPGRVMPPKGGALKKKSVETLERWIRDGAEWPNSVKTLGVNGKKPKASPPAERLGDAWKDPRNPVTKLFGGKRLDLWSLKPVGNPAPPPVKNSEWVRNPIDAFVLAKMESGGRAPAPEADKRTLARRLYRDLTGLPPSPEQTEAFLSDSSPDAYEKLVDSLIASPAYGEQAAGAWLDVARYSDSNGFDYDEFRPVAWRYRDYVIRAFNTDKPYDEFVREQLAGDEMLAGPPRDAAERDRLIATGFLRVGPYDNSAVLFGEKDRCRAQVLFDLVETSGAAFLGLNMSCCRCHDHKVDPISQADYYRLKAVFENVEPNDSLLLDTPEALKVILPEIAAIDREKAKLPEIEKAAVERVEAEKAARLPEADRRLLATGGKNLPPDQAERYLQLKRSIHTKPLEAREAFTPEEKAAYDSAKSAVADLVKKRSPHTPGFFVTDAGHWSPETRIYRKGDYASPGETVEPGVLSALDPNPLRPAVTARPRSTGRRAAFADWLFSPDNPLTARVMVNRLWQAHFGRGIQATPNDFGFAGARPTHPDLLDWLAREFRKSGWSVKKLHKLIVMSASYRQGGEGEASAADEGRFLTGLNPRRLTGEELRDSMLKVSGLLLPCDGGPPRWPRLPDEVLASNPGLFIENEEKVRGWYPSPPDQLNVRSVYLVQKRSLRLPMLETFDRPESNSSCGQRILSTVAPQALTLLNSPFAEEAAAAFAERLEREAGAEPGKRVDRAFAAALQRMPNENERADALAFLERHSLPEFCRVLMNLNEFVYVD